MLDQARTIGATLVQGFHFARPMAVRDLIDWRAAFADGDAGEVLATHLERLMQATGIPNGIAGVGYGEGDVEALTAGTLVQSRLVDNAPRSVTHADLAALFRGALSYW